MDPIANLKEQLAISNRLIQAADRESTEGSCLECGTSFHLEAEATRLAELVIALDEWIRKGGFSPWAS